VALVRAEVKASVGMTGKYLEDLLHLRANAEDRRVVKIGASEGIRSQFPLDVLEHGTIGNGEETIAQRITLLHALR
jgi:hypothetical protein